MKLKFGSGGIRAVMGNEEGCMNLHAVQEITLGVASYVKKIAKKPSIAIAYDTRNHSESYAKEAARIFVLEGCSVFIFPVATSAPVLSFTVRDLKCNLGICITASHNSREYNGYKIYDEDGCQITKKVALIIQEELKNVNMDNLRDWKSFEELLNDRKIGFISSRTNDLFIKTIEKLRMNKSPLKNLRVVYTPLNGTGLSPMLEMLEMLKVRDIFLVEEQTKPDGDFPTCPYPNPEEDEALRLGIAMCCHTNADIMLATDPDGDRIGVAAKYGSQYKQLSGKQIGILLMDYILRSRKKTGTMPPNPVIIKTKDVSSMADKIAEEFGAEVINTPVGFENIGEQLHLLENEGRIEDFILGFEENCGCLVGSHVRDKDAVSAAMIVCEMAESYKNEEKTLWNRWNELDKKYC